MGGSGATFPTVNLRKPTKMTRTNAWESQCVQCVPSMSAFFPPAMMDKLRFEAVLKTKG